MNELLATIKNKLAHIEINGDIKKFVDSCEDIIFDAIAEEIDNNKTKRGTYVKALALCNGDERAALGKYITLRAEQLKGDLALHIKQELQSHNERLVIEARAQEDIKKRQLDKWREIDENYRNSTAASGDKSKSFTIRKDEF